jgi:methylmalonyl-CoA/ethylmalonyl-CoA epimerase
MGTGAMFMRDGLSLHHVGVAVKEIEPAVKMYVQRFGYEIVSATIHDPTQTAYVRFLRLPGDATFLEFVAPDGPASKLANAVAKGGGLNHLCYATRDIEAAAAKLQAQGMIQLQAPIPAVAFPGRRIAWLMGMDRVPIELVEISDESGL